MKIQKTFDMFLASIEDKGKVNLYTLVDAANVRNNMTVIGNKVEGVEPHTVVEATITFNIYDDKPLYDKNDKGEYKRVWVKETKIFLEDLKKK